MQKRLEPYEITHSEARTYQTCQRKHHFAYVENLEPIRKRPVLWIGKQVHAGLAYYYNGKASYLALAEEEITMDVEQYKVDYSDMWDEDIEGLENDKTLVMAMLGGWPAFIAENDLDREFEVVALELEFEMRLPTPTGHKSRCTYRGKVDGILKDMRGNCWLMEHKSAKQVGDSYINQLQLDQQVPSYMAGVRECYGYDTIGCIYNILRTQLPGPRVKAPLYYREWVWRNEAEIQAQLQYLYWTYRSITRPGRVSVPNPSQVTCPSCVYRSLCIEDNDEVRQAHFHIKDRKHVELEASNGVREDGRETGSESVSTRA